jgi:transmembrane protein 70
VIATGAFLSFFTFATPLLIHFISKKYVTEMYYNKAKDSYTAITYSLLLRRKKVGIICKKFFEEKYLKIVASSA